jgi:hypothetical protein
LNVTVSDSTDNGYVTMWPCGLTRPNASNVNYDPASTAVPNLVVTAVGTAGSVCVFTSAATHLVVDVDADFPSTTSFHGLVPARLMAPDQAPPPSTDTTPVTAPALPSDHPTPNPWSRRRPH